MKEKYKDIIILMAIIVLQVMVSLYWANCKTNYHIDELYSMGYARNNAVPSDYYQYITVCPEFGFDRWIRIADLNKYIQISNNQSIFHLPISEIVGSILKDRNYFVLLAIAESVAPQMGTSLRAGILLNIVFFIVAEFFLVSLMKKLGMDRRLRFLAVFMFGFSGYLLSAMVFIRFYMLIIMLMIIILNLSLRVWNSEKWIEIILSEIGILVLTYLAYKNSELTLPFFGAFWGCFTLAVFVCKKHKQFFSSVIICFFALMFLLTKTVFIGVLFHPTEFTGLNNVWVRSSLDLYNNITSISSYMVQEMVMWPKGLIETMYFSMRPIIYILLAAVTICLIITKNRHTVGNCQMHFDRVHPVTIGSFIAWIGILIVSSMFGHGIMIGIVVLFSILVLGFFQATGLRVEYKRLSLSSCSAFVMIIACEFIIYTIFEGLCSHRIWRYYCYGFVSFTIIFWYVIDRILKKSFLRDSKRPLTVILTVFVVINSLMFFKTRNIEYIFEDETGFVETVRNNNQLDVVLFTTNNDGVVSRHEIYDCINMMSPDRRIMFVNPDEKDSDKADYPDYFLAWINSESEYSGIINGLRLKGYDVTELGTDHCSRAFVVNKSISDKI